MVKDFKSTLLKLKDRGYWKVHFYPNSVGFVSIDPINKGKEIIKSSSVQFRGWDYPHFPTNILEHQNIYVAGDKIEAWIDSGQYKEIWRFYNTGQFIHLFALREDWLKGDSWVSSNLQEILPGASLEIICAIYSITEIFSFIRNIVQAVLYKDGIVLELSLFGAKDRNLFISDSSRMPLMGEYKSAIDTIVFPKKIYGIQEIETNYLDFAFENIVYLFNQFNWDNPPMQVIKEDQKKLIERRF